MSINLMNVLTKILAVLVLLAIVVYAWSLQG